ncbi:hypothetical protein SLA2020_083610 [Shorea laevis]
MVPHRDHRPCEVLLLAPLILVLVRILRPLLSDRFQFWTIGRLIGGIDERRRDLNPRLHRVPQLFCHGVIDSRMEGLQQRSLLEWNVSVSLSR